MENFKSAQSVEALCNDNESFRSVRAYLNIHELVAVGIHTGVLDEEVCYEFWSDELMDAYRDGKPIIEFLRKHKDGSPFSYVDLEKLNMMWMKRNDADLKNKTR
jgi:hypothetical protein